MLIRFNVKNFLSFSSRKDGSSQEFSMIPGKVRLKNDHLYEEKIKLLKFAALYGANAAGKSSLVKAIGFMKDTLVDKLPTDCANKYCKTDDENKNKPSYFEVEIVINDKYYAYGFEIILSQCQFVSEWLYELKLDGKSEVIFTRDIENNIYELNVTKQENVKNILDVNAYQISNDKSVLFLNIMNNNKEKLYEEFEDINILKNVFDWFKKSLDINYPDRPISTLGYMKSQDKFEDICKYISAFGTGVTNYKIETIPLEEIKKDFPIMFIKDLIDKQKLQSDDVVKGNVILRSNNSFLMIDFNNLNEAKTIVFNHNENNDISYALSEESDGTQRLFDLIEILISNENKVFVIDELDRCLHPSMTYKFIETFLKIAIKKNIQLIVTTHEARLMDFELVRRDEIWFANKNKYGNTDIYSLDEYNERFDKKIDKAYLEGRYGGVPVFNTIFPVFED